MSQRMDQATGGLAAHATGSHFPTMENRYSAVKMGMWLFLATEVLLFGGLFVLYAIFRIQHPEAFQFGSANLDIGWGLINTSLLIFSSFTMAMAVWSAQQNRRDHACVFLVLTLMCGITFLAVKAIEYEHKFHKQFLWGAAFNPQVEKPLAAPLDDAVVEEPSGAPELTRGRRLYRMVCMSCHGADGEGMIDAGLPLAGNPFIDERSDQEIVAFIQQGRPASAPDNTMRIDMPARGENIGLSERDLQAIVHYLRNLEPVDFDEFVDRLGTSNQADVIHMTSIPQAAEGPPGLAEEFLLSFDHDEMNALGFSMGHSNPEQSNPEHSNPIPTANSSNSSSGSSAESYPENAYVFFGLYFIMTGLHGIHLVAGLIVLAWLLLAAIGWPSQFHFSSSVELGGLYWHLVDLIWIFLFPLLYLIH